MRMDIDVIVPRWRLGNYPGNGVPAIQEIRPTLRGDIWPRQSVSRCANPRSPWILSAVYVYLYGINAGSLRYPAISHSQGDRHRAGHAFDLPQAYQPQLAAAAVCVWESTSRSVYM